MARKSQSLAIVRDEPKPDLDSPERFALRCRHLKTGTGQPLQSKLFQLSAEKASDPLRGVS
jgi:hypothetical protein